jgi:hypothetical protein
MWPGHWVKWLSRAQWHPDATNRIFVHPAVAPTISSCNEIVQEGREAYDSCAVTGKFKEIAGKIPTFFDISSGTRLERRRFLQVRCVSSDPEWWLNPNLALGNQ